MLNNSIKPREAPRCSQNDCPVTSNIKYFEAERSRQYLADLYRKTEGIWDTIWWIMPVHGCLPAWIRFANPPTETKSTSLVQDDWMAKMARESQSVIAIESHGEIGRGTRKFMEQGYHIAVANSVAIRLYPRLPETSDTHTSVKFPIPFKRKFLTTLDSVPTARKLTAEKYNSNTADELARSSTMEHSLAEQPPVTKTILCELDVNKIVHELKLWHDINFDPDLHFRSNLDCGKGKGRHNGSMTSRKQREPTLQLSRERLTPGTCTPGIYTVLPTPPQL
jgi:hypothetical protein